MRMAAAVGPTVSATTAALSGQLDSGGDAIQAAAVLAPALAVPVATPSVQTVHAQRVGPTRILRALWPNLKERPLALQDGPCRRLPGLDRSDGVA